MYFLNRKIYINTNNTRNITMTLIFRLKKYYKYSEYWTLCLTSYKQQYNLINTFL